LRGIIEVVTVSVLDHPNMGPAEDTTRYDTMTKITRLATSLAALVLLVAPAVRADTFLVSDVRTGGVEQYNSATNVLTPFFTDSQLNTPFGLHFDSTGNLYVASLGTGTIYEYSKAQLAIGGALTGTAIISGVAFPNDMAFLANGNILVTAYGTNQVLQYSSTGALIGVFASGLNGPTGIAVDASGNVYVSNSLSNQILKFGPGGGTGTALGITGLDHASAITINNTTGLLYTTSFADDHPSTSHVSVFDLKTGTTSAAGGPLNGAGVAVASNGNVFVTDYARGSILQYTPTLSAFLTVTPVSNSLLTYITAVPAGVPIGAVPEPTSLALAGIGLAIIFGYSHRRRMTRAA
jgi:hypothetical protein